MRTDLGILRELNREIECILKEITFNRVFSGREGFATDGKGRIVGLNLTEARFNKFPLSITKLIFLRELNIQNQDLRIIPQEIGELKNLEKLWLIRCKISELPIEMFELKNLVELHLGNNNITQISASIKNLEKLKKLNLSGNNLYRLPREITDLGIELKWEDGTGTSLPGIFVEDNPFESPPIEIVKEGRGAVIEYFKSLEVGERLPLNEVKVLLVGDGGAGKTSLVKQLLGQKFNKNESQTHGISIRDWKVKEDGKSINVHFWDFGGQEIMHATHQFFLSRRSLYVLVLDGRKEEDAEYWLKHIESFGGDSPILVILNKMDENPGFEVNRRFLKEKYKGIKSFHRISCKKATGIDEFSEKLSEELAKVKILETTWAKSWFNVKSQLEKMTNNFISYDEYRGICENENINEKAGMDTLVDFLNDLGIVLHFKDFRLLDTHVLEPKWITQAVYKIINSEKLAKGKGVLKLSSLDQILRKKKKSDFYYPRDRYPYIVELMKKFELCYEIDEQTVLIPDLLEVAEPQIDFNDGDCLRFLIEYDFLPKSVVPRFIVKIHKDIKGQLRWRTGVVLEDKSFDSTAVIKADERDKKIYIYVNGEQRRDYFSVIRHAFLTINNSFEKLQFVEKVPMPDETSITVSYQHLTRLEKMGVEKYIPDGSEKAYKIKDLLGTIYVEKKTEEEILRLLTKIKNKTDDQESLVKKANEIIQLQPNIFGVGVNFNKIIGLIGKLFTKKSK